MSETSSRVLRQPVDVSAERPFSHAVAFIPECRPDILSPGWFDWLKEIGYTGVYLENDPFVVSEHARRRGGFRGDGDRGLPACAGH